MYIVHTVCVLYQSLFNDYSLLSTIVVLFSVTGAEYLNHISLVWIALVNTPWDRLLPAPVSWSSGGWWGGRRSRLVEACSLLRLGEVCGCFKMASFSFLVRRRRRHVINEPVVHCWVLLVVLLLGALVRNQSWDGRILCSKVNFYNHYKNED